MAAPTWDGSVMMRCGGNDRQQGLLLPVYLGMQATYVTMR